MSGASPSVASPCTGVCRIDPRRATCEGCLRTLDEIARWPTASPAEREAMLAALRMRRA